MAATSTVKCLLCGAPVPLSQDSHRCWDCRLRVTIGPSREEIDALVAETLDVAAEFQKPKTVELVLSPEGRRLADLQARATLTPGEMHELKFLVDRKWAKKGGAA